MSVITDRSKCTGCGECVQICPGDLMAIDSRDKKSYIRNPSDCWDCMACVKECPSGALETRLPYQLAAYGARLTPRVEDDRITWTLSDARGLVEEFVIRTRAV